MTATIYRSTTRFQIKMILWVSAIEYSWRGGQVTGSWRSCRRSAVGLFKLWQSATLTTPTETALLWRQRKDMELGQGLSCKTDTISHPRGSILYQNWFHIEVLRGLWWDHYSFSPLSLTCQGVRFFAAEDCLLYRKVNFISDAEQLRLDLKSLEKWKPEWKIEFHLQKCTVIPVSRKQRPINNKYLLHEHTLRSVSSGKYQGVILNWTEHICNIRQFMQDPRLSSRKSSGMYCWRQIYCVQYNAQSHLGVCSDGLGPLSTDPIQMLENVQSEAAKFVKDNYYERTPGCVTSMK